jgi:hypothetical protein
VTFTDAPDSPTQPAPPPTDPVGTAPDDGPSTAGVAKWMTLAGAVALAANFVIYAAGRALDVDFKVVSFIGMREEIVDAEGIITMTVVGWVLGTGLLLCLHHRPKAWPALAIAGAVLALTSVPFFNEADVSTKVTLAVMHLSTGGLWVVALRHLRPGTR